MRQTPEQIAEQIVDQMSEDDRRDYVSADWRDGVAGMLVDEWAGADLNDVLRAIDIALRPVPATDYLQWSTSEAKAEIALAAEQGDDVPSLARFLTDQAWDDQRVVIDVDDVERYLIARSAE